MMQIYSVTLIIFPDRNLLCFSGLAEKVANLINRSDHGGGWHNSDPRWMCCIPLLHFLQEKSKPYQDPEPSSQFKCKEWWGLTTFTKRQHSFMSSTKNER